MGAEFCLILMESLPRLELRRTARYPLDSLTNIRNIAMAEDPGDRFGRPSVPPLSSGPSSITIGSNSCHAALGLDLASSCPCFDFPTSREHRVGSPSAMQAEGIRTSFLATFKRHLRDHESLHAFAVRTRLHLESLEDRHLLTTRGSAPVRLRSVGLAGGGRLHGRQSRPPVTPTPAATAGSTTTTAPGLSATWATT